MMLSRNRPSMVDSKSLGRRTRRGRSTLRTFETRVTNQWICYPVPSRVTYHVSPLSFRPYQVSDTDSPLASDPSAASRRRKPGQDASHFKTDKSGKLVIDEPTSDQAGTGPSETERMAGDAFLANQTSTDGATRDARGALKFNKNTKRARETEREYEETFGAGIIDQDKEAPKKKKQVSKLGEEFRSKVSPSPDWAGSLAYRALARTWRRQEARWTGSLFLRPYRPGCAEQEGSTEPCFVHQQEKGLQSLVA